MKNISTYLMALALWLPQTAMGYTHTFSNNTHMSVVVEMRGQCGLQGNSPARILLHPGTSGKLESNCRKDQDILIAQAHRGTHPSENQDTSGQDWYLDGLQLEARITQTTKKKDSPTWIIGLDNAATTNISHVGDHVIHIRGTDDFVLTLVATPTSGWTSQALKYVKAK